jgi:putative oxidoreductase
MNATRYLPFVGRLMIGLPFTVLALFALATAVSFHSNFADQNQMIHFLKNVMMAGGLLQIVAFGAGAVSMDNRRTKGGA